MSDSILLFINASQNPRRTPGHDCIRRNVFGHDAARAHDRVSPTVTFDSIAAHANRHTLPNERPLDYPILFRL